MPTDDQFWANDEVITDDAFWANDEIVDSNTEINVFDEQTAGQIYDTSVQGEIPINEAENVYAMTAPAIEPQVSDGLTKRFIKQYYNSTVGNVVTQTSMKSNVGQIGSTLGMLRELREDFYRRAESGQPVTEQEIETYVSPRRIKANGQIQTQELDERAFRILLASRRGELNVNPPLTPQEALKHVSDIQETVEEQKLKRLEQKGIVIPVEEPETIPEKVTDAAAGILGFVTQIGVLKKAAPSMPEWMVWEQINQANGGMPGQGMAMQMTLGGINRVIPGTGFTPALARGATVSGLFGTTTYFGGGDTTDVLINMGIPFAFEALGMTRQSWARHKNKTEFIKTIKDKAPALKDRPDIVIDKAIADLLNDTAAVQKFAAEKKGADISAQVRDYIQRQRYDQLLERAGSGDKQAIKELNDHVQGVGIPSYDELLNKYFNGDIQALDLLNAGEYRGGPNQPAAEFKIPVTKEAKAMLGPSKRPAKVQKPTPVELSKSVYMKGFIARLTSIRNNADNLIAGAGKKKTQIKTIKEDLAQIEQHYKSIEGIVEANRQALAQISEIQRLLPEYSKAVNEFADKPSKEGFQRIKDVGDRIADLSLTFGEQLSTAQVKQFPVEETKTPIQKSREAVQFAENADAQPGALPPGDMKKARERGFITSVKEILPELRIEGQYIPRETDPLAIKARNLIHDNIDLAEQLVKSSANDKAVATASELIKYYGDKGLTAKSKAEADIFFDKAAEIAVDMAAKLTEAGRTVQAASILGRMTPEGQVRFAAKEIQRYNKKIEESRGGLFGLRKKIPDLTGEQAKYILNEMAEIQNMPEGRARNMRFHKLQMYVSDLVPTSLYQKLVTIWKAGLLTGLRTHGLNLVANISHLGTETIKDIPASIVDKISSFFTGERKVTFTVEGLRKGGLIGAGEAVEYIKSGYSERDVGTKLDIKRVNMGKGPTARALQFYTEATFRILGAGDQPIYYAAKMRSFYDQAQAAAINQGLKGKAAQSYVETLVNNPTEKMIENATKDAEAAVFVNKTKLGDIARGIQRLPGGEIIVPFGRTPSAIAMQIVNYSPVGIAKTIIENIGKGRFDQRAFSQGLGRGITGTAVLVIGVELFKHDLITLDRPKDERQQEIWKAEGRRENSILIDGKWRSIQTFGPAGNLLIIGGHFKRAFDETGSPTEAMTEALSGSAKSFTEQTFLKGVNQFVDALSDPQRSAPFVAGSTISTIIPTFISDVARATDVAERRADTVTEKILSRIPVARRTLEPAINVLGQEREPTANPIELMLDPTRPSRQISTPVVNELRRLWNQGWEVSPNLLGGRKGYEILTPAENTALWKRAGDITRQGLEALFNSPQYEQLPDERKAENISKIISQAQNAAKTEIIVRKLNTVEDADLAQTVFEMRKQGLATEEILPIALSKRNPRKALKEKK